MLSVAMWGFFLLFYQNSKCLSSIFKSLCIVAVYKQTLTEAVC